MYEGAGRGAPAGVRAAIRVWRRLSLAKRSRGALLWWLLGPDGTPPFKMPQLQAAYQPRPKDRQKCANCDSMYRHVPTGTYICDQIRGAVVLEAWCRLWRKPLSKAAYVAFQEGTS